MWNAGLGESQAGIKIARRNLINLRYADDTNPMAENEELKSPRGEWKNWLKTQHSKNEAHGIWSHHFMANRRVNSGSCYGFYILGLQNCSHEIKKMLSPGKESYDKLESILKSLGQQKSI